MGKSWLGAVAVVSSALLAGCAGPKASGGTGRGTGHKSSAPREIPPYTASLAAKV